ncbi:MAG: endonuclease domain-containing protein [Beijerinckiaceae bacterium]
MRGPDEAVTERARRLRRQATFEEKLLWFRLQNRRCGGFKFVRQEPIGRYIADFCCREMRLVVEADGGQHADNPADVRRDAALLAEGYRTLRFTNQEIREELESVTETILAVLEGRV